MAYQPQVLVRHRNGPATACSVLTGVPAFTSTLIDVIAAPTAAAAAGAAELARATVNALRTASSRVVEDTPPSHGFGAFESFPPEWHRVLVIVADVAASAFDAAEAADLEPSLATPTAFPVLPLLQRGLVAENLLATPWLRSINAAWWDSSPAENVDEVLALADLGAEERRVFVSYRRPETLSIAEQIFEVLEKLRFDVFVDRFRVPPGTNFQERLTDELAHKSMVLVLESPSILGSEWVAHELGFAKDHGLGHLAVHLPGGVRVPWLDDAYRVFIVDDELEPPIADGTGTAAVTAEHRLGSLAIARLVDRLVAEHSGALLRRRGVMIDELRFALSKYGNITQRLEASGHLHVTSRLGVVSQGRPQGEEREYVLWITTRPPEIDSFRTAHGVCDPEPQPTGAIITATTYQGSRRRDEVAWLADRSLVRVYENTDLTELAARISRGENLT